MTEVIFSFDTEDFTSNRAADAIYREAEILREEGVRGGFCVVGLLAQQLKNWGRTDVIDALKHHDILTHSYGHSLHPTINEYTDKENFDEAYKLFYEQEKQAIEWIKDILGCDNVLGACPPGNQKSYVAMYGYSDMGLPIYADTVCDTVNGRGVHYCNIYQTKYTFTLEWFLKKSDDAFMREKLDELAENERVICFTHPNMAIFTDFWDALNYWQENKCEFGQWKYATEHPAEKTEQYYESIRRFIRMIKSDKRFHITDYKTLYEKLTSAPKRVIYKSDILKLKDILNNTPAPIEKPSLSLSDLFLACKDFLNGADSHICGKVYGFLKAPYSVQSEIVLSKADVIQSAKDMDTTRFLPEKIKVGESEIGPFDWLCAAMEILSGAESATVIPKNQLPNLDHMPRLKDLDLTGWVQRKDFEDKYLSKRLQLQSWTMRY